MLWYFKIYNDHFLQRLCNSQYSNHSGRNAVNETVQWLVTHTELLKLNNINFQPHRGRWRYQLRTELQKYLVLTATEKKKVWQELLWAFQNTVNTATKIRWRNKTLGLCQTEITVYNTTCPATYHASHKLLLYRIYKRTYSAGHKIPFLLRPIHT